MPKLSILELFKKPSFLHSHEKFLVMLVITTIAYDIIICP